MNRTYSLRKAFPSILNAANISPPCEIVILNYGSKDDLDDYIIEIRGMAFAQGNYLTYKKIDAKYYHETRSRNIAFKASHGDYVIHMSAEMMPAGDMIETIRKEIDKNGYIWMNEGPTKFNKEWQELGLNMGRCIVCQREEFEKAGGYDERFEVCSPDDKDICMRLHRRGGKYGMFSYKLIEELDTPVAVKYENLNINKYKDKSENSMVNQLRNAMRPIYEENNRLGVLVANEGKEWGV